MKAKVMMIIIMMMVLASVSMYAGGFDYRGVWMLDTFDGYMCMNNPKNRIRVNPSYYSVELRTQNGNVLTYSGKVRIKDQDHIVVTDQTGKQIKLVREDYVIYAKARAWEMAKSVAKIGGEAAVFSAFCMIIKKVVATGVLGPAGLFL